MQNKASSAYIDHTLISAYAHQLIACCPLRQAAVVVNNYHIGDCRRACDVTKHVTYYGRVWLCINYASLICITHSHNLSLLHTIIPRMTFDLPERKAEGRFLHVIPLQIVWRDGYQFT